MLAGLLGLSLLFGSTVPVPRALADGAKEARPGATEWEPSKTWALMIGVLEFKTPTLATYPKEGRLDRVLEDTLYLRGVPREHVTFLEDRAATLAKCREALKSVAAAAGRGSTLIVYYAGHGGRVSDKTFFCPYDHDPKDVENSSLWHGEIAATLAAAWKGSRLLLMGDCCESGGLGSIVATYRDSAEVGAASLTSAMETHASTGSWTFSASVIRVLVGDGLADADGDHAITFDEADRFVRREMRWRARQLTSAQRSPSFEPGIVLAHVLPADAKKRLVGLRQIGDYAEVERQGGWSRGEVLDVDADGRVRVRYLDVSASSDEWVEPARLRSPKPIAVDVGDAIEIEWGGRWWKGSVRATRDEFALVHYDSYGPEWDEWVGAHRVRRVE